MIVLNRPDCSCEVDCGDPCAPCCGAEITGGGTFSYPVGSVSIALPTSWPGTSRPITDCGLETTWVFSSVSPGSSFDTDYFIDADNDNPTGGDGWPGIVSGATGSRISYDHDGGGTRFINFSVFRRDASIASPPSEYQPSFTVALTWRFFEVCDEAP